jgi:hypothetical protein
MWTMPISISFLEAASERDKSMALEREISNFIIALDDVLKAGTIWHWSYMKQRAKLEDWRARLPLPLAFRRGSEVKQFAAQDFELDNEVARLAEISRSMDEERSMLEAKLHETTARRSDTETKYTSALTQFEESAKWLSKEYEGDTIELRESGESFEMK